MNTKKKNSWKHKKSNKLDYVSLLDDVDGDLEGEPFNTWPTKEYFEKRAWIKEKTLKDLERERKQGGYKPFW